MCIRDRVRDVHPLSVLLDGNRRVPTFHRLRRAAGAIESIHDRVSEAVGFRVDRRIDVVVGDPQAAANGMAFPYLDRPFIVLWTSPPEAESELGTWNDWMEDLVTHEVAHIVHLTRPRNRSRGILARISPV